ncbi:MAG TPA: LptF/LptG family permease [Chthonomonadaceae bacterium]|nr:LptF/LptG family permease [Chthonomonadaceae bacterium]
MRLVDRLVLKDLIGPFINGLMMFLLLVFAAGYLFKATDLLVQGVPLWTVIKLIAFNLPSVLTDTFPMATLLAGLLAFGRLSGDHEAVALFAAGISFPRIIRAVLYMGIVVSIAAFLWNDWIVPPATTAFWDLQQEAVKHLLKSDKPLYYPVMSPDGKMLEENVSIAGGYDAKTQTLRKVTITRFSTDPRWTGQPQLTLYCDTARPQGGSALQMAQNGLNWTYYNGYVTNYNHDSATGLVDTMTSSFQMIRTSPRTASVGKTFDEVINMDVQDDSGRMNFIQLQRQIQKLRAAGRISEARGKEVDLYGKLALPLASLIFGVLGAALGVNTQRGGSKSVGFGMAIFVVFLYWVFYHAMFVVGKNGGLPPPLASFLADITGAIVALVLTLRASR